MNSKSSKISNQLYYQQKIFTNFENNLENSFYINQYKMTDTYQNFYSHELALNNNSSFSSTKWITVAKLLKVVGNRGYIKIQSYTDFPYERFKKGSKLYIKNLKYSIYPFPIQIDNFIYNKHKEELFVKIMGIQSREALKELIGSELVIPLEERKAPSDPNAFYPDELEGMTVVDSSGEQIGTVICLEIETPAPYISILTKKHGEVMVPFRTEFIEIISRDNRLIKLKHNIDFHIPV